MISLINFGASPFRLLFYIVLGIFALVIVANALSSLLAFVINKQTHSITERRQ